MLHQNKKSVYCLRGKEERRLVEFVKKQVVLYIMENNNLRRNRGVFIEAILFGAASSLVGLVLYNSLKSETVDAAVPQQKKLVQ